MLVRRALPLLAAVALLAACGPDDVTPPRLEQALAADFSRLYVRQQDLVGQPGLSPEAVAAQAACARPGGGTTGAGEWTCTLRWFAVDGSAASADYDVTARAGGCFTATGPVAAVGAPMLVTPDGQRVVNPVYGIDGCFPPAG